MSADILNHPMLAGLRDAIRAIPQADTDKVLDLHAERVRREREASERRHRERNGEWTPSGDAA